MSSGLDEFRDAAADSLSSIVGKGKKALEVARLRNQIRRLERSRRDTLSTLGERVYRMLKAGALNQDALRADCDAVAALDDQIARLRGEIAALEAQSEDGAEVLARCTCGQRLTEDTRFCRGCGKNVEAIVKDALAQRQEPQAQAGRCKCGAALAPNVKFCGQCGKRVEEAEATPVAGPAPPVPSAEASLPPPVGEPSEPRVPSDAEAAAAKAATRPCPLCGGTIPAAAKFCRHCGKSVAGAAEDGG